MSERLGLTRGSPARLPCCPFSVTLLVGLSERVDRVGGPRRDIAGCGEDWLRVGGGRAGGLPLGRCAVLDFPSPLPLAE